MAKFEDIFVSNANLRENKNYSRSLKSYIEHLTFNIEELQSQKMKVNSKLLKDLRIWSKYPTTKIIRINLKEDKFTFWRNYPTSSPMRKMEILDKVSLLCCIGEFINNWNWKQNWIFGWGFSVVTTLVKALLLVDLTKSVPKFS